MLKSLAVIQKLEFTGLEICCEIQIFQLGYFSLVSIMIYGLGLFVALQGCIAVNATSWNDLFLCAVPF
jgi:hypothetical protein